MPIVTLLDLRESPLDVAEVQDALLVDAAGGINLFVGTVRDHDHGQGVRHLDYTAHPTALEVMRAVAEEVAAAYDVHAVAAVHRVGLLQIGDTAVITGVSAAHRGEAFAANQALIDRLKERTPIWKHQVFADDTEEWVNTP